MTKIQQVVTKHLTLLLFIGLAWGQVATSITPNDKNVSDKLIQSFRSDLGKFYTMTYYGEFLGKKKNKVYFKPINDAPLKLLRLKEIKKLTQKNQVLIKNGKWKIKPESIKPYEGTFIDLEELNTVELSELKKEKLKVLYCGCGIISVAAIGYVYYVYASAMNSFRLN